MRAGKAVRLKILCRFTGIGSFQEANNLTPPTLFKEI